jgi:uncharacterized protein with von Willebrand factor type A (vWA) domain
LSRQTRSKAGAADLLTGFATALREAGLAVDSSRTAAFLAAVSACRLRGLRDLSSVGRITLTSTPEDFPVYDDVFGAWFGEATFAGKVPDPEQDHAPRAANPGGGMDLPPLHDGQAAGQAAAGDHLRHRKSFAAPGRDAYSGIRRLLDRVPVVVTRKRRAAATGDRIDVARTARAARRTFGETLLLMREDRPATPRRLLLLIDVSGSMKAHSELYLRFAHLAARRLPKVETFSFGTRLSRVTGALKHRNAEAALARLSQSVFDFDGGTLIGASLEEFLSVSRYTALVRGAVTIVFSDGLERGDPAAMIHAVERLARLSHRLVWATPLAADPRYRPATRGMAGVLPLLDALCDAGSLPALERMLAGLDAVERMPRGRAGRRYKTERKAA